MADTRAPATASPPAAASPVAQPADAAADDAPLVPDEDPEDSASELGSLASSSTSVSSSILDYRTENGRTYHRYKDGKYSYPNDERENDRLDLQHNLFLLTYDNKLGNAPPAQKGSGVKRVLDVGTGTGLWAIEFGDEHPEAEITGVDLSAVQPEFTPPNVKFEIDDIEEEWTFSQPFDYIHSRMMTSSLANWRTYLQRCYDGLEPGGYLELNEMHLPTSDDGTISEKTAIGRSLALMHEALNKIGRPFHSVPELRDIMEEVGFRGVTMNRYRWPLNPWPKDPKHKELGIWNNENINAGIEGFMMAPLTRILDWTKEEVQVFLVDVRKDINNRNIHGYYPIFSVWGRKPTEEEAAQGAGN